MKLIRFLNKRGYEVDNWDDLISENEQGHGVIGKLAVFAKGEDPERDFILNLLDDGRLKFGSLSATLSWKLNNSIFELADFKKTLDAILKDQKSK